MRKIAEEEVELLQWESEALDRLFRNVRKYPVVPVFHETIHGARDILLMFKIPLKYDLYHIANAGISITARRLRPCVITVHDLIAFIPWIRGSPTDSLLRMSMKNLKYANGIICISEYTKKDLLRFLDVNPSVVRVIHYGVDPGLFKPRDKRIVREKLNIPQDKKVVLNVGSEEPRKNVETLIRAFHRLQKDVPDTILVRVGAKMAASKKLIKSLGLMDKVFYFRVGPEEVPYFYNAADLFVFPSYYEGFGLPPLEAMASGLPMIASNRTSIPEVVGGAGILLDPFDVGGFAYWMREILTNECLKAKLSEEGYKRSLIFSWEKCAKKTLEVYAEVLDEI